MFCSKCGTEIPEGASVCPNCGAAASSIEATNEVTKNNKPPKKKMSKGKKALVIVGVIAALLIFIGQYLHHPFGGKFRRCICAPVGSSLTSNV